MKKIKVACYVRVSTQEQATKGYSIGEQTDRLKAYCAAMKWDDVQVYSDPGFSGASLERPGIQHLIADCEAGRIDKVVVYKLDRLSRSQKDTLHLIEDVFQKTDTDFISLSESFDTSTPFGKAAIGMLSVFAQLEREQIKERMIMGKDARAKRGLYKGGGQKPIGYYYNPDTKSLEIDDAEMEAVRYIFDRFLAGDSFMKIARDLNAQGVAPASGKWYGGTVSRLIRSRIYCGYIKHHGKWIKGEHEPIIEQALFDATQAHLADLQGIGARSNSRPGKATSYLGGLLHCKCCGGRYYKAISKYKDTTYQFYICENRYHRRQNKDITCDNSNWKADELEAIVFDELKKIELHPPKTRRAGNDKTALLSKEIKKLDRAISKLIDAYAVSDMPLDTMQVKLKELTSKKERISLELTECKNNQTTQASIQAQIRSFNEALNNGSVESINAVLRSIIRHIDICKKDISIYWQF